MTPSSAAAISRAEVVGKYRRLMRKQRASTPKANKQVSSSFSDENWPTPSSSRATTPHRTNASPLSPKNNDSFNAMDVKPPSLSIPSRIRRDALSSSEPSPLGGAPSPSASSSTSNSARRQRLARHAKLLGNRGGRSSTPLSTNTCTPQSNIAVTETPVTSSSAAKAKYGRASTTLSPSVSKYYSYHQPTASASSSKKSLPPKTPYSSMSEKKKNIGTGGSVCSMDPTEVSRRARERRARGAKKLFILATTPSLDDGGDHGNLTPLERHLISHENDPEVAVEDCPSVASDVSTLTMSTLSSLARDKRKFSRERKYSSSKLYARATGSTTGTEEKAIVSSRGRSPVRRTRSSEKQQHSSSPKERGTPVRSNSAPKRALLPAGSRSTTSGSAESATSALRRRRATSMQKAKRLARSRSKSVDRRRTSNSNQTVERQCSNNTTVEQQSRTSVFSQQHYASPAKTYSSSPSVSSTPMSVDSSASTPSRAGNRAASVQKARRTLARTKSQGKMKVAEPTPPLKPKSIPPIFAAREKVVAQARSLSLAPQTRRNLDKRTARLKYHNEFAMEVVKCQEERGLPPPNHAKGENLLSRNKHGVSIFVRKRPILNFECEAGDFDVVFTEAREGCDAVVIHSCNMHADMTKMLVKPVAFSCSAAFDEWYSNDEVYTRVGKPLVRKAANGGLATLLTYGQTGSGKSYTIDGMEERVSKDIFGMIPKFALVKVQFVELAGKQCHDLLGDGDVKLVDQKNGSVLLLNAASVNAASPEALYNTILRGKRKRATASTDKNDASSRSHAVCQITVTSPKNENLRGVLTLIDCAGSERRNDSLYHSRDRQRESTEINSSLWALKECIRTRASGGSMNGPIPYRSSNLTRILRESLEREDALLCVIATIAPNATDTEHSIETLKTITQLVTKDGIMEEMKTREVTNRRESTREKSYEL